MVTGEVGRYESAGDRKTALNYWRWAWSAWLEGTDVLDVALLHEWLRRKPRN